MPERGITTESSPQTAAARRPSRGERKDNKIIVEMGTPAPRQNRAHRRPGVGLGGFKPETTRLTTQVTGGEACEKARGVFSFVPREFGGRNRVIGFGAGAYRKGARPSLWPAQPNPLGNAAGKAISTMIRSYKLNWEGRERKPYEALVRYDKSNQTTRS